MTQEKKPLVTQTMPTTDLGFGGELQAAGTAAIIQEIQGAMVLAKKFPRNIDEINLALVKACHRRSLADAAVYSFPRGGTQVKGPSVNLARVAAQAYGNIRWGLDIIRSDDEEVLIRGWAWDIETNTKVTADDRFKKLIFRKANGGQWIVPDERDLRELTNRRGAILVRNCLLQVMPKDLIEDAMEQCYKTIKGNIKDVGKSKKECIKLFDQLGVTVRQLQDHVKHSTWTKDDLVELKQIYNSIKDGQAKIEDIFVIKKEPTESKLDPNDMTPGDADDHQGYGDPDENDQDEDDPGF